MTIGFGGILRVFIGVIWVWFRVSLRVGLEIWGDWVKGFERCYQWLKNDCFLVLSVAILGLTCTILRLIRWLLESGEVLSELEFRKGKFGLGLGWDWVEIGLVELSFIVILKDRKG